MCRKKKWSGYTLLEVVVAISILALLVGISFIVIRPGSTLDKARDTARALDAEAIADAVRFYQVKNGTYPITFPEQTQGWVVGGAPATLVFYDGISWDETTVAPDHPLFGNTNYVINDIDILSPVDIWGVSNGSGILRYDGSGQMGWSIFQTEESTFTNFASIDMLSPVKGWIGGGGAFIMEYNGSDWSKVYGMDELRADLFALGLNETEVDERCDDVTLECSGVNDIQMISDTEGWAVGGRGIVYHFNGINWEVDPISKDLTQSDTLTSISMTSPTEGWAAFHALIHYDGVSWKEITPPFINANAFSLKMIDSDNGWMGVGTLPEASMYQYDGANWEFAEFVGSTPMRSIWFENEIKGWGIDGDGKIWKFDGTQPFGSQWILHTQLSTTVSLQSIYVITTVDDWVSMIGSGMTTGCDDNNDNCEINISGDEYCVDISPLISEGILKDVPVSSQGSVVWDTGQNNGDNGTGYSIQKKGSTIVVRSCEAEKVGGIKVFN